eukprot:TRINITY_DN3143_c0_g1_i2.p1 TRINITY_DN3143_c0_g1~~TRINITY_DN3143_c0_g1_i2.p1  ORF type:complete len:453 (+),score=125.76 TRINITY_DN3143_c0_g1_i2:1518-2876(+)
MAPCRMSPDAAYTSALRSMLRVTLVASSARALGKQAAMSLFEVGQTWWGRPLYSLMSLHAAYPNSTAVTEEEVALAVAAVLAALVAAVCGARWLCFACCGRAAAAAKLAVLLGVLAWGKVQVDTSAGALVPDPSRIDAVQEFTGEVTPEVFTHRFRGHPVVARKALKGLERWTPQALAAAYGQPGNTAAMQLGNVEQDAAGYGTYALGDFFRNMEDPEWVKNNTTPEGGVPYFAEENSILHRGEHGPEYMQAVSDMFVQTLTGPDPAFHFTDVFMWAGPRGVKTGLHTDWEPTNLLHQLYGEKTVYVIHPHDTPYCYPSEKYDLGSTVAQVDPFAPDFEKHPLYKKAQLLKVVIGPGDVLQIPAGWMHYVHCDTGCISLSGRSFNARQTAAYLPVVLGAVLHRFGLYRAESTSGYQRDTSGTPTAATGYFWNAVDRLGQLSIYKPGEEYHGV